MESKEEIVLDPIPLHFNPKVMLLTCKNAAAFLLVHIYMTTKMCFRCTVTLTYVGVARPRWVDFWYGVFSKFGAKFVLRLCLVVYTLQVLANYSVQTCYHLVLNFVKTNKPALWKMSEILFFNFYDNQSRGRPKKLDPAVDKNRLQLLNFFNPNQPLPEVQPDVCLYF